MSAFITDQFRILNAGSFVESISNNSYYAFLGLSNPQARLDLVELTIGIQVHLTIL